MTPDQIMRAALQDISDTLGATVSQLLPTDNKLIAGHIREALDVARNALRETRRAA